MVLKTLNMRKVILRAVLKTHLLSEKTMSLHADENTTKYSLDISLSIDTWGKSIIKNERIITKQPKK